jgi:signal transduction histidine kinase
VAWRVAAYDGAQQRRAQAASGAATLATLDRRLQGFVQVASGPRDGLGVLRPQEVVAVYAVQGRVDGPASLLSGAAPSDAAGVLRSARTPMDIARDSGTPATGSLVDGVTPVAVALLRPGSTPSSTQARRAAVAGWRLALLSPAGVLAGLPRTSPRPVGVRVDGALVGTGRDSTSAGTVWVGDQPWTLLMADPGAPLSRGGLGVLLVTLLGSLACLASDLRTQLALNRQRWATAALERETRTVAEIGPLLQSSLDLAEVLPAVGLRLADEFGLQRFCIELVGEQGALLEAFALGTRVPGPAVQVVAGTSDELLAGALGALPLQRAGRTIGRMTFAGFRDLGHAQLAALSAAADLVAVATYNAELFEREQASVRRLRELDQLKDAFLGTISHELRTPLTAISGFVRLLRDKWDLLRDEQRREFLDRVHGNTLSLGLLVDDLLDFARLERQALNAPAAPLALDEQVATILAQLSPVLGAREVVTTLEPVRALGNPGALVRVLANLLTNAAKFSPPDSPISVSVRREGRCATLEVADLGAGIAPEDRERVFTRFFRGDSDAAVRTRGAGIGLSVVRELVSQMGGSVSAQPNTPRGTRMVVQLALEDADPTALSPRVHAQRSAP